MTKWKAAETVHCYPGNLTKNVFQENGNEVYYFDESTEEPSLQILSILSKQYSFRNNTETITDTVQLEIDLKMTRNLLL